MGTSSTARGLILTRAAPACKAAAAAAKTWLQSNAAASSPPIRRIILPFVAPRDSMPSDFACTADSVQDHRASTAPEIRARL